METQVVPPGGAVYERQVVTPGDAALERQVVPPGGAELETEVVPPGGAAFWQETKSNSCQDCHWQATKSPAGITAAYDSTTDIVASKANDDIPPVYGSIKSHHHKGLCFGTSIVPVPTMPDIVSVFDWTTRIQASATTSIHEQWHSCYDECVGANPCCALHQEIGSKQRPNSPQGCLGQTPKCNSHHGCRWTTPDSKQVIKTASGKHTSPAVIRRDSGKQPSPAVIQTDSGKNQRPASNEDVSGKHPIPAVIKTALKST